MEKEFENVLSGLGELNIDDNFNSLSPAKGGENDDCEVNMGTIQSKASNNVILRADSFGDGSDDEVLCEMMDNNNDLELPRTTNV